MGAAHKGRASQHKFKEGDSKQPFSQNTQCQGHIVVDIIGENPLIWHAFSCRANDHQKGILRKADL